ncbi:hypothetical protein GCM10010378_31640 [Streptomyces viridochromogenes]
MTETDSAISGGSVRDVLADTNNLSERWKAASGSVRCGQEPTTGLGIGPTVRAGAGKIHSASNGVRIPFLGCHLLGHRAVSPSVTPILRGPSHIP